MRFALPLAKTLASIQRQDGGKHAVRVQIDVARIAGSDRSQIYAGLDTKLRLLWSGGIKTWPLEQILPTHDSYHRWVTYVKKEMVMALTPNN